MTRRKRWLLLLVFLLLALARLAHTPTCREGFTLTWIDGEQWCVAPDPNYVQP